MEYRIEFKDVQGAADAYAYTFNGEVKNTVTRFDGTLDLARMRNCCRGEGGAAA